MHNEAMQWLRKYGTLDEVSVLDIGGRNINGSARVCWPNANPYVVLDILPGGNVDIVADAADWKPDRKYDVVVCAEVFEHTNRWREICMTSLMALKPGGLFVATMAGPGRQEHSAYDGGERRPDEWYGNVDPGELREQLQNLFFEDIVVDQQFHPCDVRAVARRGSSQ